MGVGLATVDLLCVVPRVERRLVEVSVFSMQGGGSATNILAVLSTLGVSGRYFGRVGDDEFGRFILRSLQGLSIDTSVLSIEKGKVSPVSVIEIDELSHKRKILLSRGNVTPLSTRDLPDRLLDGARLLCIDGSQPALQAAVAEKARAKGVTVLLNAIYAKTGLVTFHGNDVMWGFGRHPTAYDREEFLARLVEGKTGRVSAAGPRKAMRSGRADGCLLGGNLHCLLKLAGTPYFPDFSGAILCLESLGFEPAACDCMFRQLQQMGVFDQVAGVIVGYIDGVDNLPDATLHMEEVLLNVAGDYRFPILKANDFGHNCPNTTLPVGARVRLDAEEREIEILEQCVNH